VVGLGTGDRVIVLCFQCDSLYDFGLSADYYLDIVICNASPFRPQIIGVNHICDQVGASVPEIPVYSALHKSGDPLPHTGIIRSVKFLMIQKNTEEGKLSATDNFPSSANYKEVRNIWAMLNRGGRHFTNHNFFFREQMIL